METENTLLEKAKSFAMARHEGHIRNDWAKAPYSKHLDDVVKHLRDYANISYEPILCAAYLHDILEYTNTTADELFEEFGEEICGIFEELTDNRKFSRKFRKANQIIKAQRLSRSASLIALADKICNFMSILMFPRKDCSFERHKEYVAWGARVVESLHFKDNLLFDKFVRTYYTLIDLFDNYRNRASIIGFETYIWAKNPALKNEPTFEKGVLLATWFSSDSGVNWIENLVDENKAVNIKSGGYPSVYRALAKHVLPLIASGPPPHEGGLVIGDDYVMPPGWNGESKFDQSQIEKCGPEDELEIVVWDQS